MKRVILLSILVLNFILGSAQIHLYKATEINVNVNGLWRGWETVSVDIVWDFDEDIIGLMTEDRQFYQLGKFTTDKSDGLESVLFDAYDQNGVDLLVIFSKDKDGKFLLTISYNNFLIVYKIKYIQEIPRA